MKTSLVPENCIMSAATGPPVVDAVGAALAAAVSLAAGAALLEEEVLEQPAINAAAPTTPPAMKPRRETLVSPNDSNSLMSVDSFVV
jgi:hypothetical protein